MGKPNKMVGDKEIFMKNWRNEDDQKNKGKIGEKNGKSQRKDEKVEIKEIPKE